MIRLLIHIPVGVVTAIIGLLGWYWAFILFASFIFYEQNEDWHIKDGAYKDVIGFIVGYATTSMIIYILRGL
jgi:hypothetical protein